MSENTVKTPENSYFCYLCKQIKHVKNSIGGRQKVISKERSSLVVVNNLSSNNKHALVSNYRQGVSKNSKENANYNFKWKRSCIILIAVMLYQSNFSSA